jgi:hypothetical protein
MLPGIKIYRVQGTDAYRHTPTTKRILTFLHRRGTPLLYASEQLQTIVGLSGTVIPTPIDTSIFKRLNIQRDKDVLYYCRNKNEDIYRIDKLREYQQHHPNESVTLLEGAIPHKAMNRVYNRHKKYLRWTTHDANPKMIYEALLCGCEVWFNDDQITTIPDMMYMNVAIPKLITYFERICETSK